MTFTYYTKKQATHSRRKSESILTLNRFTVSGEESVDLLIEN